MVFFRKRDERQGRINIVLSLFFGKKEVQIQIEFVIEKQDACMNLRGRGDAIGIKAIQVAVHEQGIHVVEKTDAIADVAILALVHGFQGLERDFFALDAPIALEPEERALLRDMLDAEQMAERFSVKVHFDGFAGSQVVSEITVAKRGTVVVLQFFQREHRNPSSFVGENKKETQMRLPG